MVALTEARDDALALLSGIGQKESALQKMPSTFDYSYNHLTLS
jgi:hypothetical protein